MERLMNGLLLEEICKECNGTKKNKWLESGKCEACSGIGTIPTKDGLIILNFVKKYVNVTSSN